MINYKSNKDNFKENITILRTNLMGLKQAYEIDKESHYKSKKYVVKIFPENVSRIDSLDIAERDQFVNNAISAYLNSYTSHKKQTYLLENIKKSVYQIICLIILFALLGAVVRFLTIYSNANNAKMENNFQMLFDNYHLQ